MLLYCLRQKLTSRGNTYCFPPAFAEWTGADFDVICFPDAPIFEQDCNFGASSATAIVDDKLS